MHFQLCCIKLPPFDIPFLEELDVLGSGGCSDIPFLEELDGLGGGGGGDD